MSHIGKKVALTHLSPRHESEDNIKIFPDVRKSEVLNFLFPDLSDEFSSLGDRNVSSSLVIDLLQESPVQLEYCPPQQVVEYDQGL